MSKKLLLLLALVFWPCYSYSESIAPYYGYTGNAAADQAYRWAMDAILPDPPGLDVENVIYSYKIEKETGDLVTVYVYNENAVGDGYIFRERDDWLPGSLSGTQINKVVPLGRVHRDLFGDGGIDVEGPGSVYDASVVYTYRVDPCYDPQFDSNCPNYATPVVTPPVIDYEIYDAVAAGDASQAEYELEEDDRDEDGLTKEEKEEQEKEEKEDSANRLEKALFEAGRAELFALALTGFQLTAAAQINLNTYTSKQIQGGVYNDNVVLKDRQLPDAKNGLRNGFAQQLLHQEMVDMQYDMSN